MYECCWQLSARANYSNCQTDDIIGALHQESDSLAHKARKRGAAPQPLPCGLHVPDAAGVPCVCCVFGRKFIERAAVEIKFIQNKMGTEGDASLS